VIITCPIHGDFTQKPSIHFQGKGCKECGEQQRVKKIRSNTDAFIEKARKLHGNKYDYSKVDYITIDDPVIIICPSHGEWSQTPKAHLRPYGCFKCGIEEVNRNNMTSFEDFVEKAKKVQGAYADRYVVQEEGFYSSGDFSITVYCKEHDFYWDTLKMNFLKGRGCPRCHASSYEKIVMKCLDDRGLKYDKEKVFKDLAYDGFLRFDFYIPSLKLCIEVNGAQHYKPVDFYGGEEEFEKMKERDTMKVEYCSNNDLSLEIIRFDSDIESRAIEILEMYY
jgi:ferredoxin-like protein FixX/very-short-patch-repair endonuclease